MRDRVFINKSYRDYINEWNDQKTLGINMLEAKEVFLLAVALGLNSPSDIQGTKEGYVRLQYFKTFDKALIASTLLGKRENASQVDKYANLDTNYDEAEKCAETGFLKLKALIDESEGNQELLEKRIMKQLMDLYQINVAPNL